MASFSSPLVQTNSTTFTYQAGLVGGVLIGDYVNDSSTVPSGSSENMPQATLVATVPVSAILELQSTTGALLIMRMTTTQRNALTTLTDGMMIFNTSTVSFQFYQNSAWVSLSAGAGGVTGPGSSTDNAVVRWDGASGAAVQNSTVLISDAGAISQVTTISADVATAGAPTYTFFGDTDTGIYRPSANIVGVAAGGALIASVAATGLTVTGLIAATTTVTAGTNLVAGASGSAGTIIAFPATAANGTLILAAGNAGGAFNTTVTSGTIGQSTVYTIPDIGASTGGVVVSTAAVRMKSVAGAAAAGGAAAQSFTDTFCTSGSNVIGNWNTQANPVQVLKIVPGNGSFVVTSSGDAGVGTFNYIITK